MRFTAFSLFAIASAAFAAPSNVARSGSLQIKELRAVASSYIHSANIHFTLTSTNYPDEPVTDCNVIWSYGKDPETNARCNNGKYYIRFPNGGADITQLALELERVSGSPAEKGQVYLGGQETWVCGGSGGADGPQRCDYTGVLTINV
ncbi:hypothetical protein BDV25DRAFT_152183 [Aspergillus avenaceus]|uniref:AA1-like domain-containing protein n=1 Tax=Aspergillus avenaceus TaxID=36643 RepID=A0A5N6TZK1_ASPAV|nr:hypothetical protein BDV25DRAFT_152183 [Aspergillus avenaceus]